MKNVTQCALCLSNYCDKDLLIIKIDVLKYYKLRQLTKAATLLTEFLFGCTFLYESANVNIVSLQ